MKPLSILTLFALILCWEPWKNPAPQPGPAPYPAPNPAPYPSLIG